VISTVTFGCVNGKGLVSKAAIGIRPWVAGLLTKGIETMKGNEGDVSLNDVGAGSMKVTEASIKTLSRSEKRLNFFRVMRSENEGNGVFFPGLGRPGSAGTFTRIPV